MTLLLSIIIVFGGFGLAWYLVQRLTANAARLKELHEDLARQDRELQRRLLEIENKQTHE